MPEKVLAEFPTTRFVLAGADPLRDDGYAFGYRLGQQNIDIKILEFKELPHGFLNYDIVPFFAEECS